MFDDEQKRQVYIDITLHAGGTYKQQSSNRLTAALTVPKNPELVRYAVMKPFAGDLIESYSRNGTGSDHVFYIETRIEDDAAIFDVFEPADQGLLVRDLCPLIERIKEKMYRPVIGIAYKEGTLQAYHTEWDGYPRWHDLYEIEVRVNKTAPQDTSQPNS